MEHLQDRVAVVTGAASGLGWAMSKRFAGAGMKVVLADIEADRLVAAVRELRAAGHDASGVVTDVAEAGAVNDLAAAAFGTHGAVHVLCNNAGVVKRARVWELTLDDWNWVLGVDFWSVVHGVRAFVPRMLEQGEGGHIVNTSSMAGLLPMPNLSAQPVPAPTAAAITAAYGSLGKEVPVAVRSSAHRSRRRPVLLGAGGNHPPARRRPGRPRQRARPPGQLPDLPGAAALPGADPRPLRPHPLGPRSPTSAGRRSSPAPPQS